ncbi:hypothetical protein [Pseudomonas sp. AA-38]|uniref:hypothetical protein n=1 Tax=Pseudomonas sp. AA-38 TaxID=3028807 RepID=UPI0023F81F54|nr:hypothetical protein [Pseudomonas sp. AA-38]
MQARVPLIAAIAASLTLAGLGNAQASNRSDAAIAGVVAGAVIGGVIASSRPAPIHRPPPPRVYYYPAQPVHYAPRAYYAPPPGYYYPPTRVVVVPAYRPYPPPPYREPYWRRDRRW